MKDSGTEFVSWRGDYDGCSQGGFAVLGQHLFYTELSLVFDSNFPRSNNYIHPKAALSGLVFWSGNCDSCCRGGVTILVLPFFFSNLVIIFDSMHIRRTLILISRLRYRETFRGGYIWWLMPRRSHRFGPTLRLNVYK